VLGVLCNLSLRYPEAGYSPEQLLVLSQGFFEDLSDECIDFESFSRYVRECRKTSKFFPKMKQIIEIRDKEYEFLAIRRREEKNRIAIAQYSEDPSEEEVERNLKYLEVIKKMLSGDISMEQAQARQELLRRGVEFIPGDSED
jgi:hypothetical protein